MHYPNQKDMKLTLCLKVCKTNPSIPRIERSKTMQLENFVDHEKLVQKFLEMKPCNASEGCK